MTSACMARAHVLRPSLLFIVQATRAVASGPALCDSTLVHAFVRGGAHGCGAGWCSWLWCGVVLMAVVRACTCIQAVACMQVNRNGAS
jgi:hypothetical protein